MNTLELGEEHSPHLNNIQSTSNIPENHKIILELIEQMIYTRRIFILLTCLLSIRRRSDSFLEKIYFIFDNSSALEPTKYQI